MTVEEFETELVLARIISEEERLQRQWDRIFGTQMKRRIIRPISRSLKEHRNA